MVFLKQRGVRRGIQVQASCLSLAICLRFLWSSFPGKMERKEKEKVLAWLLTTVGLAVGFWLVPNGVSYPIKPSKSFKKWSPLPLPLILPGATHPQSQKVPKRGFLLTFPERTWAACWLAWCQGCLYWFLKGEREQSDNFSNTAVPRWRTYLHPLPHPQPLSPAA